MRKQEKKRSNMGIFEEHLRERLKRDDAELSHSIDDVIDSLRGKSRYHADGTSMENLRHELELICQFYKVDIPSEFHDTKQLCLSDVETEYGIQQHIEEKRQRKDGNGSRDPHAVARNAGTAAQSPDQPRQGIKARSEQKRKRYDARHDVASLRLKISSVRIAESQHKHDQHGQHQADPEHLPLPFPGGTFSGRSSLLSP